MVSEWYVSNYPYVVVNRIHIPQNEVYKIISDVFNESSIMKDQVKMGELHIEWHLRLISKSLIGWVPTSEGENKK